jgi:phosphomannomutase
MVQSAQQGEVVHQFHPSILREYDIRGVVGETLHTEDAYYLGRAFATEIAKYSMAMPNICVARDGRLSSPKLEEALIEGLNDSGAKVIRVGLGPTPMLYFAVRKLEADGGIMITGSHNPPTHNGFKMMRKKMALFGQEIQALGALAAAGDLNELRGHVEEKDMREEYLDAMVKAYHGDKSLKVAWDAGNGAAGEMMQALTQRLPGEHSTLFADIDGNFPHHHPDPSVEENIQDLIAAVQKNGCDVGIAFDGDGDRIGVVDGEGNMLAGDQLMAIFAEDVLKKLPGRTIIADVKASQHLFDHIQASGGKPLMWKTGHSLVKAKMVEVGAPFAGEMSGHMFFADHYYGFDDGLYAAVRLLDILARSEQTLAEKLAALPKGVATPEMRIECPDERKFAVIEEVQSRLQETGADYSDIDGVRVNTSDGWWLLRASNTQSALVARCEAADDEALETLKTMLAGQLKHSNISL